MVSVAGVPFLAHLVARARAAGIERLVMATSYLPETFGAYFGDGSRFGLQLEYVTETEPLGTGGAIRNAARLLTGGPDSPVAVLNGDILSGTDISLLVGRHRAADADVTLHLTRVDDPRAYGLVPTDPDGRVLRFLEKPTTTADIVTDQINMRLLRLPPLRHRLHPRRAARLRRARDVPRPAGRGRPGPRGHRRRVLAGPGHARGPRTRLRRPRPRQGRLARPARPLR